MKTSKITSHEWGEVQIVEEHLLLRGAAHLCHLVQAHPGHRHVLLI